MSLPPPVTTPKMPPSRETARHECVSEDALQHLKTYKYSSVDKSFISRYILKHYVRPLSYAHPSGLSLTAT
jgi:ethanolaminephosphotransferase